MFIYQRVSIYIIRDLRSFLLWWKSQHHLQIVTVQNKNNAFWNRWCSRIFHPCNLFPAMTLGRQYGDSMGEISWHLNRNVDTKRLIFNSMLIPGKKKQMSFSLNNSHRFSPKMGDFPMDWHNVFFLRWTRGILPGSQAESFRLSREARLGWHRGFRGELGLGTRGEASAHGSGLMIHWIGLREHLQETMVFTIKYRAFL